MCIDSFKVRNDMCRYRPGAFSVLFLEEGENMSSPSDVRSEERRVGKECRL